MERKEGEGIVDLMDWLLTYFLHPSPSFPRSVSASHLLPHALTLSEESILLTSIISPYLSLSLSPPLHSGHSVPIEYFCCGHKWACVSPVPQQSYHVLIRSIPVARLILLHRFPHIIGQKPQPTCQQELQYKCCNLFFTAIGSVSNV